MDILKYTKELENLVSKYDLKNKTQILKDDYSISTSKKLEEEIKLMQEENRELKLGIIGRVKAGKSSLINALIFNGKDILPKAATPMTAALTVLKYSDTLEAEVDFFSQEDVNEIKSQYESYRKQYQQILDEEFKKLCKRAQKQASEQSEDELRQKAKNIADRQMKQNQDLSAGYDQFERIQKSGLSIDNADEFKKITADSIDELNQKLYNFVGADGKYMPLTKSVTIKINEERLKNIEIIDTPGLNDPVVSREARTKELLKTCDVVLIVSPSGQFLSSEDFDLLHRITSKNGIREIYIVASQVDNQLFASEKDKAKGILKNALQGINNALSIQQKSVLNKFKEENSYAGSTIDELINSKVILSSSVAFFLLQNYDDKSKWDENTNHVWKNLTTHYKDFFDDKSTALTNLALIAGIEKIQDTINKARDKKDEILEQRKNEFEATKYKNLSDYKEGIKNTINEAIEKLKSTDINELKSNIEKLQSKKSKAIPAVEEAYDDKLTEFELDIKEILNAKVDSYFKKIANDISQSEGSESYSYKVEDNGITNFWGLFGDRYKEVSSTRTVVNAGFIRNSIDEVVSEVENLIEIEYKQNINKFKKSLYGKLISSARNVVDDDILDVNIISRTIRSILNSVEYPEISYNDSVPSELNKSGTLKGYEAEEFIQAASEYCRNLKTRVKSDIKTSVNVLLASLKNHNVAKDIFAKYDENIASDLSDLQNKEQALDKYKIILEELNNVGNN